VPARVGARVAQHGVGAPVGCQHRVAFPLARPHVVGGVGHVAGVGAGDQAGPAGVAREDPVLGQVRRADAGAIHRGGGEVGTLVGAQAELAAAVPAVPPDLVAVILPGPGEVVADGQVLDRDTGGLPDLDAVPPAAGVVVLELRTGRARAAGRAVAAVDDHPVPVQAPDVDARSGDPDTGRRPGLALLVVHPRPDQHPVPGAGGLHGRLNGRVVRDTWRAGRPVLPLQTSTARAWCDRAGCAQGAARDCPAASAGSPAIATAEAAMNSHDRLMWFSRPERLDRRGRAAIG
jgi:hypothetical protein